MTKYTNEEFQKEEGRSFGFLFDSKGSPLAFINDGSPCCFIVSYNVDDSEFDIPSGYKKVKVNDLDLNLSGRR